MFFDYLSSVNSKGEKMYFFLETSSYKVFVFQK